MRAIKYYKKVTLYPALPTIRKLSMKATDIIILGALNCLLSSCFSTEPELHYDFMSQSDCIVLTKMG